MPWLVGIDEAGYGPNLGPFVMTLVACQTPDDGCLWDKLKSKIRRAGEPAAEQFALAWRRILPQTERHRNPVAGASGV